MGCVGSLPRQFLLFNFLWFLVSSVSDFHLDTGRAVVDTLGSLFSRTVGREGCCKQILLACACSVSSTLGLPLLAVHTAQALCSSAREPSEASPGLHAPPQSKLLRLRHSGSAQRRSLGWACALCPSQVRAAQVFGERGRCDLSPLPSLLLCFLGVQLAPLLRRMVTAQSPKKSQLAKKPACSLVVNVSLGLRLPPSGPSSSGCLSPEGDGQQPPNSVPSFVLCVVLAVSYVSAFHVSTFLVLLAQVSLL